MFAATIFSLGALAFCTAASSPRNAAVSLPPANACPQSWLEFQGSCFWASEFPVPWRTVAAACRLASPHALPASVHSRFGNAALQTLLEGKRAWLGLRRDADGPFVWNDTSAVDFTFWQPKEPTDIGDCAIIDSNGVTGQWAVADCESEELFTCRQPKSLCPGGWWQFEDACYLFNGTNIYPSLQASACHSIRADAQPVSIHTLEASYYLAGLIDMDAYTYLYIGLSRSHPGDPWRWEDGSPLNYENWGSIPHYTDKNAYLQSYGIWTPIDADVKEYPFLCQITL